MREAAERVRVEREEFLTRLATVTGRVEAAGEGEVSRRGRLAGDWLERPDKAGYPFPSGQVRFSVIAAATRGPRGRMRICHVRAMPNDHKPSWVDFFRSLPGKPDTILSDPDPQIDYALREVWPEETPLHPLSTWHYWAKIQEKFVAARLYPWNDVLCRDSEAAFKDPQLFRAWRARASSDAPRPIRTWLKKKGDEVQVRLEGATPPLAIGDLETFLNQRVAYAVDAARGKIRNLRRLDIRLALIALDQNRQLKPSLLETILGDEIEVDGVAAIRSELEELDRTRREANKQALLALNSVELELNFTVSKGTSLKPGINLKIVSFGGSRDVKSEEVQKVRMRFDGRPSVYGGWHIPARLHPRRQRLIRLDAR